MGVDCACVLMTVYVCGWYITHVGAVLSSQFPIFHSAMQRIFSPFLEEFSLRRREFSGECREFSETVLREYSVILLRMERIL